MLESIARLRANVTRAFLGNEQAVERLIRCLIACGHVLIEDVPGVGKTLLAAALARSIDCRFSRIQLTPDMLPGDVLGVSIYDRDERRFEFQPGPIFANIVLADEINRTTPRTQTALLEAMNESCVTVDGRAHRLGPPFMIVATQNPHTFEGTYPLPESQLDRFFMRISVGYPTPEQEAKVLEIRPADQILGELEPVMHKDEVIALQRQVDRVRVDPSLIAYVIALASATRDHEQIELGLSPRGALALAQAARASAVLDGRDHVVPEDILDNVLPIASHRILLRHHLDNGSLASATDLLDRVVRSVPCPA